MMQAILSEKFRLIQKLVREGVIRSERVKKAFLTVPREEFVPQVYRKYAYDDTPLPTLEGQTISAPHMCAIMCELLDLKPGDKLVEIGTGSGYHAALCSEIVSPGKTIDGAVVTMEIIERLARYALSNLKKTGYLAKIDVIVADGSFSLPLRKTFTRGIVTAAVPQIPKNLLEVIKEGGRIIAPVGSRYYQELLVIAKKREGEESIENYGGCLFVPLKGIKGYGSRYSDG
ncbi:MAG: protein-L-isoaspartate O-methyltransferase [Thermoprotei archaeon]|nr:MAG: protein-L-isoaspartate O-methyltransferase [Thermoprotei archaeon]